VYLVGFIIRIYQYARSFERQISELCFCNYLESQSNLARGNEGDTIFRQSMHFQISFIAL